MTTLTVPERLLSLGTDFTRHLDALKNTALLRGPNPAVNLWRHIPTTQALAREALAVSEALRGMLRLYHSPDVRAAMQRSAQLGALATLAADHLVDAADLLRATTPTSREQAVTPHAEALPEARRCTTLAEQLTSLGAEDCLATARLTARELHRQFLGAAHRPPALSPAQHTALEAIAAGRVTFDRQLDKPHVRSGGTRIAVSTIRSLESCGLAAREPCPLWLQDERIHLTADGCRGLAAAFGRVKPPALTAARPASRPVATAARIAAR
ncbi:hypothetical protein ABZ707_30050 [Streptomyces sp. NPDC006923]|uniref:hypothetical protein n=1 Tax=Streptomyces sp. NPDC006923 TaxID=3155355 RepID=UPI0033D632C2